MEKKHSAIVVTRSTSRQDPGKSRYKVLTSRQERPGDLVGVERVGRMGAGILRPWGEQLEMGHGNHKTCMRHHRPEHLESMYSGKGSRCLGQTNLFGEKEVKNLLIG